MKRRWRWLLRGSAATAGLLLVVALLAWWLAPRPDLLEGRGFSAAVEAADGSLLWLATAPDDQYRLRVALEDIATDMRTATLLYEDRRFYRHRGIDIPAVARAAYQTYLQRERVVGASTISMQLARLRFDLDTRHPSGKLRQMWHALRIERHYDKDDILEAYLNLAPYGHNIQGVGAASRIYYDKPADRLTLAEALTLAVIPQHPAARTPTSEAGLAEAEEARGRLLAAWRERHPEDRRAALVAAADGLAARAPGQLPFRAPHFVRHVLTARNGNEGGAGGVLRTTLEPELQRRVEHRLRDHVRRHADQGIRNAAALIINYRDMSVRALVGSADFTDPAILGQVDGTAARRSPGSALKPFLYALAMDQGLIHPATLLEDAPLRYGAYTPENFDRGFMGPVTAAEALVYSRNVPAVALMTRLASPDFYAFLEQAGMRELRGRGHYGISLALGSHEVSMRELAGLYAMLARGGHLSSLRFLADEPEHQGPALLSPEAAFLTLNMLADTPAPSPWDRPGRLPLRTAWKTGTSYAYRDAWTVGVVGDHVIAVWAGNFDGEGNPALVGRRAAAPLFFDLAAVTARHNETRETRALAVDPTLNLRRVEVCAATGDLPGPWCPRTREGWFIPGVSPIRLSEVHQAVPVNPDTGRRACRYDPERHELQVYEFWPSNLHRLFRRAGVHVPTPPPYEEDCPLDWRSGGAAPRIQSPDSRLDYVLRGHRLEEERIPFIAVTEADAAMVYWFVDDRFVGTSMAGQPFFWRPRSGDFVLRAVDDQGRASRRPFTIVLRN